MILSVVLAVAIEVSLPALALAEVPAHYQVVLTPPNYPGGFQGHVAMDGDLLAAAANTSSALPGSGAVGLYRSTEGKWSAEATLEPADRVASDLFGEDVDVDGDVAVVGAPGENYNGMQAGAVWVYRRVDGVWRFESKLLAPEPPPDEHVDEFGATVAVSGGRLVVGAKNRNNTNSPQPWAWVYAYNGTSWTLEQRLEPSGVESGFKGSDVDIDGSTVIVGSAKSGTSYIFSRDGNGTWRQDASLRPAAGMWAGSYVTISGNTAAAAEPNGSLGVVAIYERGPDGVWREARSINADPVSGFGWELDLKGDVLVGGGSGGAAVVTRDDGMWSEPAVAPRPPDVGAFGNGAVATNGGDLAVGGQMREVFLYRVAATLDTTPPSVTAVPERGPGQAGWYNAPVTVGWSVSDDSGPLPTPAAVTVSMDGAGQVVESALVCDPSGNCARGTTTVSLDQAAPTVTPVVPAPNAAGWHSGPVTVEWQVQDRAPSSGVTETPAAVLAATEGRDVGYASEPACDVAGNCAAGSVVLPIDSTAPAIGALAFEGNPKAASSPTTVSASVSDALSGVVRGEFFLGPDPGVGNGTPVKLVDGRLQATVGTEVPPGVYTLSARVADAAGNWSSLSSDYLVVYDPEGGFVTGGGRIDSPAGAYTVDPTVTGSASFGFVSKYQKGATVPTGSTEFQFRAAGFRFTSEQYEWLVVSGARAQYKGSGRVNGQSGYGFLLTVTDGNLTGGGGTDKFRLKVTDPVGHVVYDNLVGADDQLDKGQGLAGGSVTIHKQ